MCTYDHYQFRAIYYSSISGQANNAVIRCQSYKLSFQTKTAQVFRVLVYVLLALQINVDCVLTAHVVDLIISKLFRVLPLLLE
jgi:hypothetical protein